jgi:hypothetical protein
MYSISVRRPASTSCSMDDRLSAVLLITLFTTACRLVAMPVWAAAAATWDISRHKAFNCSARSALASNSPLLQRLRADRGLIAQLTASFCQSEVRMSSSQMQWADRPAQSANQAGLASPRLWPIFVVPVPAWTMALLYGCAHPGGAQYSPVPGERRRPW